MKKNKETLKGFRVNQIEIRNFGGFDSTIVIMVMRCAHTILTGLNGAGKSTLVDALQLLFTPRNKLHFNSASSATSKRKSRTLSDYVQGAYGDEEDAESADKTQKQYLRREKSTFFSTLVAHLENAKTGKELTLAQVIYHPSPTSPEVVVAYISADHQLTIKDDFAGFKNITALKKALKEKTGVIVHENPTSYFAEVRRVMGMKNSKGLELFSKLTGLKAVESITQAIRDFIIEGTSIEPNFDTMCKHQGKLKSISDTIEKNKQQIASLAPLKDLLETRSKAEETESKLSRALSRLASYFDKFKKERLESSIADLEQKIKQKIVVKTTKENALEHREEEKDALKARIDASDSAEAIRSVERDLKDANKDLASRTNNLEVYQSNVKKLGLDMSIKSEQDFMDVYGSLDRMQKEEETGRNTIEERIIEVAIKKRELQKEETQLLKDLEFMQSNKTAIPAERVRARNEIAESLGVPPSHLPFMGEIINIKPEAKNEGWSYAIEDQMKGNALSILVHEDIYAQADRLMHSENKVLRWDKVSKSALHAARNVDCEYNTVDERSFAAKLEFNEDYPHIAWVKRNILKWYKDVICLDDYGELNSVTQALFQNGRTKKGTRSNIDKYNKRQKNYLGWNNEDIIFSLQNDIIETKKRLNKINQEDQNLKDQKQAINRRIKALEECARFEHFDPLDVASIESLIARKEDHLSELKENSTVADDIVNLEKIKDDIIKLKDSVLKLTSALGGLESDLGKHNSDLDDINDTLEKCGDEASGKDEADVKKTLDEFVSQAGVDLGELNVKSVMKTQVEIEKKIRKEHDQASKIINSSNIKMSNVMSAYKTTYVAEANDLIADEKHAEDFVAVYDKLMIEDLPSQEEQFRNYLSKNLTEDIGGLLDKIEEFGEDISTLITDVNRILRSMPYSTKSYVTLEMKDTSHTSVSEFKAMLTKCIPDVGRGDIEYQMEHYKLVVDLIEKLRVEPSFKARVLDIKNYYEFRMNEWHFETEKKLQTWTDSSDSSGGEGVKLTYTILSTAVAIQYGIVDRDGRFNLDTFAFVTIDEVFAKMDPVNSKFVMDIFEKWGLQLLVVTPSSSINVVEDYIYFYNIVEKNPSTNKARVSLLTKEDVAQIKRKDPSANGERSIDEALN